MYTYSLENFTFFYPGREKPALQNLNLEIPAGEFLLLSGSSGCGKTTLLRHLKPSLAPHGERRGQIFFQGKPLQMLSQREDAQSIGFVQQSPENQIVTDKVWHELAFGLESLGMETADMRLRIAEMASFFGIQEWFREPIHSLSGGQKQLLNLASVMVMQPSVLILDEPTSQLDPIAAREFLDVLLKVNRELGASIILSEHRLEEVFHLADRVLVMEEGRIVSLAPPRQAAEELRRLQHPMFAAMPAPVRIWSAVPEPGPDCPLTVREGRNWLSERKQRFPLDPDAIPREAEPIGEGKPILQVREASFRYTQDSQDVLRDLSLQIWPGQLYAIVGGNGVGKSTTLSLLSGLRQPQHGQVELDGRLIQRIPREELYSGLIAALPQNPQSLFVKTRVEEDLFEVLDRRGLSRAEQRSRVEAVCHLCQLESLLAFHPYDLSGGEQQRAALAKVLLLAPRVLLLDEPTKGLDAHFKKQLAQILHALCDLGVAVLMVSHDIEFCAAYADRCAMFFDGSVVAEHSPRCFFSEQSFYTTAAHRMAKQELPRAVLAEDVVAAAGGKASPGKTEDAIRIDQKLKRLFSPIDVVEEDCHREKNERPAFIRSEKNSFPQRKPLSSKSRLAILLLLLCVPLTILAGVYLLEDRRYSFISILVLLETMLPFFLAFEGRKPQARELVLIAVLVATGVAGRAAFYMLPQVKPVAAITIIAGICLGGESGFLVGALTAFVSNMLMGQGPWTPWQMLGFGLIGLLAGLLSRWGWLRNRPLPICIFGFLSTFFIYGGLLNPASVLMYQPQPTWEMILSAYVMGIPFDLLHAGGTFLFLLILARPMIEKLERVKQKYGVLS
ncbi:MAG: ATP-binding cassette domain-containing protein [Bacillota bacterium]|nr:ATP-binding cassette domain-containing protein [Bacillota bacterium]